MHQGAALESREYRFIYLLRELFALPREDHAAARPSQRLMGRRRHDVEAVVEWIFRRRPCDESRDVRHVPDRVRAHLFRDRHELSVIELPRIRGISGEDYL